MDVSRTSQRPSPLTWLDSAELDLNPLGFGHFCIGTEHYKSTLLEYFYTPYVSGSIFTFSRPTGISNSENPKQKYEFITKNDFPNAIEKCVTFWRFY